MNDYTVVRTGSVQSDPETRTKIELRAYADGGFYWHGAATGERAEVGGNTIEEALDDASCAWNGSWDLQIDETAE